jgi:hypothetical protein
MRIVAVVMNDFLSGALNGFRALDRRELHKEVNSALRRPREMPQTSSSVTENF